MEFFKRSWICLLIIVISNYLNAQEWETPVINGYGEVIFFEHTASQLNKELDYKLIFDIKSNDTKDGVNKGLWVIARTLNLFRLSGIPNDKIQLVGSIHGDATFVSLNDIAYNNKFGIKNPNSNIINQLKKNGVELYICSQATASREINNKDLNSNITPALSGIAVLSNHLLQGFTLMPN